MKIAIISLFIFLFFQTTTAGTPKSFTMLWDWDPGSSGYAAGPNRDVAFSVYLRTEYDPDYDYNYPLISGIDNCWWNVDQYTCEITINHEFESRVYHYFVVFAYLVEAPNQKSSASNEVEYCPDCANQSSGANSSSGGGGGCLISVSKD